MRARSYIQVLHPSGSSLWVTMPWLCPQNESHSFCQVALSAQFVFTCPLSEPAPTPHDLRPRVPHFSLWFVSLKHAHIFVGSPGDKPSSVIQCEVTLFPTGTGLDHTHPVLSWALHPGPASFLPPFLWVVSTSLKTHSCICYLENNPPFTPQPSSAPTHLSIPF